jgi:hypothetical protein
MVLRLCVIKTAVMLILMVILLPLTETLSVIQLVSKVFFVGNYTGE